MIQGLVKDYILVSYYFSWSCNKN